MKRLSSYAWINGERECQLCTCSKNSANSLTASLLFLEELFSAISSMVS